MEIALGAAVALLGAVIGTIVLEWLTGRRLERHFGEERFRKLRGLRARAGFQVCRLEGGASDDQQG